MVVFAVLYGIISWTSAYYGEMITYLGMSAPMAICALVAWIRNPFKGNRAEVKVNRLGIKEILFSLALTAVVTVAFYFILRALGTANLLVSTISVATSFFAVYLTFRRSAFFALAYAANDLVLIILWSLAPDAASSYVSVIICFVVFLINDLYGFFNWTKMMKRQKAAEKSDVQSEAVARTHARRTEPTADSRRKSPLSRCLKPTIAPSPIPESALSPCECPIMRGCAVGNCRASVCKQKAPHKRCGMVQSKDSNP